MTVVTVLCLVMPVRAALLEADMQTVRGQALQALALTDDLEGRSALVELVGMSVPSGWDRAGVRDWQSRASRLLERGFSR